MAFNSIGYEKPLAHISLMDWNARLDGLRSVSHARQADACAIRSANKKLLGEANIETAWANVESNDALNKR